MEEKNKMTTTERLKILPVDIYKKEMDILNISDELEELNLKLKMFELEIYMVVEAEIDKDGKKVYSNKDKRDIETAKRMENNKECVEIQNKIKELSKKVKIGNIEYKFMRRLFEASKALARLSW